VQRLYETYPSLIIIHANEDKDLFIKACYGGNIDQLQWLHGLGCINIHCHDEFAFRYACALNKSNNQSSTINPNSSITISSLCR
jgi:hypothetical protein